MNARFKAISALASIAVWGTPVSAQQSTIQPIIGNWAGKGVNCRAVRDSSDERILKIKRSSVDFYESSCRIRSSSKNGDTYSLNLICESEGSAERKNISVSLISNNEINVKGGMNYVRCP